jgi:hypothetical protein
MPCQNNVYPGKAQQFLEAALSIPEKLRGFARNRSATSAHDAAPSASDGTVPESSGRSAKALSDAAKF